MDYTQLKAPLSGHISRHLVDAGNLIKGGPTGEATLLTTIVSADPIHFYFNASEYDLEEAKATLLAASQGEEILAQAQRHGETEQRFSHKGHIDFVDNMLDSSTGTVSVRAIFSNKDHSIRSGMFGRVRIKGPIIKDALLVPATAISQIQEKKQVYMLEKDGAVTTRFVKTGINVGPYSVISEGLSEKDVIVVAGQARLRPGMKAKEKQTTLEPLSAAELE